MAVTLAQAAQVEENQLRRGIMEMFVQENAILPRLPLMEVSGNAFQYYREASLPSVDFRSVNEAYVESTGTFDKAFASIVILGGDSDIDRFIQQTRSNTVNQRAEQDKLKVKALSYKFSDHFFNGDSTVQTKGFDGLKKLITGAQIIDAGTNGAGMNADDATRYSFLEKLDQLVASVQGGPDVLYANAAVIAKLNSVFRRVGGADLVKDDITGRRVVTWNGVPILDPGLNLAGAPIIPATETLGTSGATTSSVYAVKFGGSEGDRAVTGLSNGGIQVDDLGQLQEKPAFRTRIEFYCGLALFGAKGAARLRGVIATPGT